MVSLGPRSEGALFLNPTGRHDGKDAILAHVRQAWGGVGAPIEIANLQVDGGEVPLPGNGGSVATWWRAVTTGSAL